MRIIEKGYKKDIQICSRNGASSNLFKVTAKNISAVTKLMVELNKEKINLEKLEYKEHRHSGYKLSKSMLNDIYTGFESTVEIYSPYTVKIARMFKPLDSGSPTFDKFIDKVKSSFDMLIERGVTLVDFYFLVGEPGDGGSAKITIDDIPQVDYVELDGINYFRTYHCGRSVVIQDAVMRYEGGMIRFSTSDLDADAEEFKVANEIQSVSQLLEVRLGRNAERVYRQYVEMFCRELLMQTITYRIAIPKRDTDSTMQNNIDDLLTLLGRLNRAYFNNKSIRDLVIIHNELYLIKQKYQ